MKPLPEPPADPPDASCAGARRPLPFTDQHPAREEIEACQLACLNETLGRASALAPFYRGRLPSRIASLDELASLPFTAPSDIAENPSSFVAVPAPVVARMVSIPTSGSQGASKRIANTEGDLEATRAFFAEGLHCIARAGETTAVLFPCDTPGGIGSLICDALSRIGAAALAYGLPGDPAACVAALAEAGATSAVGSARTLLDIAQHCTVHPGKPPIARVLLSSDNAGDDIKREIALALGCEVFEHYGMTETGYGAAVDCQAHAGMHIREFDLIIEIVDPATGAALPDGEEGEVVVTTLTREAMPLIRYRTGDLSRIIPGTCPCGGTLRRLGRVKGHAIGGIGANPPSWKRF